MNGEHFIIEAGECRERKNPEMIETYTEGIENSLLDMMELDLEQIWNEIEQEFDEIIEAPGERESFNEFKKRQGENGDTLDAEAPIWQKLFGILTRDYALTSRFALMRILSARAGAEKEACSSIDRLLEPENESFSCSIGGKNFCFDDISIEHADALEPEESENYLYCLENLAAVREDYNEEECRTLLEKAWFRPKSADDELTKKIESMQFDDEKSKNRFLNQGRKENKKNYGNRLRREEALKLGHLLGFSLQEMEWFMLRVFDNFDGFRYNLSDDLLEAYGFLSNCSWKHLEKLKQDYRTKSAYIEKEPRENFLWGTQAIGNDLYGKVEVWKQEPEKMDERFMSWLLEQAPWLDSPSRTATEVYRIMAVFAGQVINGVEPYPEQDDVTDVLRSLLIDPSRRDAVKKSLFSNGIIDDKKCKDLERTLLLQNAWQGSAISSDRTQSWHVLTVRRDGKLSSSWGEVNGRNRVEKLLEGEEQVEKGDLLYLLWFVCNMLWREDFSEAIGAQRFWDFKELCDNYLTFALLPAFYPPHPIERSMLLSLIIGSKNEDALAAEVYDIFLFSQRANNRRDRKQKNVENQPGKDMLALLEEYDRQSNEKSQTAFAEEKAISEKTLSAWLKAYQTLKKEEANILKAINNKKTVKEVARTYNIPQKMLSSWLEKYGEHSEK